MRTFIKSFFRSNGMAYNNGSIVFLEKGTTNKVNVYKDDETTLLPNPMPILNGRAGSAKTSVMLPNVDVEWEAHLGPVVTDPVSGDTQCSGLTFESGTDNYRITSITAEGTDIPCVDTIALLESYVGMQTNAVVCSLGYYSKGDREPVFYRYSTAAGLTADGGHVIGSSSTGKWVSLDSDKSIDSMLYGVRGEATMAEALTSVGVLKMAAASAYSVATGKPLHLNCQNGVYVYLPAGSYSIEGKASAFTNNNQSVTVKCDNRLSITSNNTYKGQWTVNSEHVKTSQFNIASGSLSINSPVVDYDAALAVTLRGALVNFSAYTTEDLTLHNCTINSNGFINTDAVFITITGSHVTQSMFKMANFSPENVTLTACSSDVSCWNTGDFWWFFNSKVGNKNVDFNGMTYSGTIAPTDGSVISNGTITTAVYTTGKVTFKDCTITSLTANDVILERCTVGTFNALGNVIATDTQINGVTSCLVSANFKNGRVVNDSIMRYNSLIADGTQFIGRQITAIARVRNCSGGHVDIRATAGATNTIAGSYVQASSLDVTLNHIRLNDAAVSQVKLDNVVIEGVNNVYYDVTKFNNVQGYYKMDGKDCASAVPASTFVHLENVPVYTTSQSLTTPYVIEETLSGNLKSYYVRNLKFSNFTAFKEQSNAYWTNGKVFSIMVQDYRITPTDGTAVTPLNTNITPMLLNNCLLSSEWLSSALKYDVSTSSHHHTATVDIVVTRSEP